MTQTDARTLRRALAGETPPLVTPFEDAPGDGAGIDGTESDGAGTERAASDGPGTDGEASDRATTDRADANRTRTTAPAVPAVDHDALASVVEHVREGGVDALFPCGTTGEFASLTAGEQRAVIETVVDASGDLPVVAGVSATAVADAVERAEAAADAGADAVVCTPAYFHGPNRPAGAVAFLERVAERSPLPLVLYDIPQNVGSQLSVDAVADLAERPDVLGIKDSSGDLAHVLAIARETPEDFLVLQGYDALLVPGLRTGLDGGVNALANVVPEVYDAVLSAPETDRARRASDAIADLFEICLDVGFATAAKTALVHRGVLESDAVRPPLVATPESRRDEVGEAVETALDAL